MPRVFIPPSLRTLTGGRDVIAVPGDTVGAALDALEAQCPGVSAFVRQGDALQPGLIVSVGGTFAAQGLRESVREDDEIHLLPAIGGG